jgi:predicted lipoprotein with Yx(FWY)xxD motif
MKRKITLVIAIAASLAIALIAAGYGSAVTASSAAGGATVSVRKTALGRIVVDGKGHTLYLFEKDKNRRSACYGLCATYWPPLLTHGKPLARAGAKQSLLGRTRRRNGSEQVTYAGHPLYRFSGDSKPGQTNGQGLQDFGGGWDAVSPAGKKVEAGG